MSAARGVFVTGTDTGVGKTRVACGVVRALREAGVDIGAMKPMETGVENDQPLDAIALREAAGGTDPLEDVCPLRYLLPASPDVAAAAEGAEIDLGKVDAAFARLAARHDAMLVEGAGGLLVPTRPESTMADLALHLGLPLLVVVRGALGTINHTRLTLSEAAHRGCAVAGVVISHSGGVLTDADAQNLARLRDELGDLVLAEIPPLEDGECASSHIDAARISGALGL